MPIFRELVLAVPALIVCLLVSHAVFGPDLDQPARPSAASSGAWIGAAPLAAARWIAKDSFVTGSSVVMDLLPKQQRLERHLTPHARIHRVFAQFVPGERGGAI